MGGLYVLDPAPWVKRPPYDFIALGARRTEDGLLVDLQVLNGSPRWRDSVVLSSESPRNAAVMRIAPLTTMAAPAISDALLELSALAEGAVRKASEVPEWQDPAPFWSCDPPPFPITAIPVPALQRFIQEVSAAYETPADFAAMGVLAALSSAIGNRRRLHVVGEIYVGACLWIAIIGKPGSGKSDPVEKALEPISNLHEERIKLYLKKKEEHDAELAVWEGQKKEERGEKPVAPSPDRLMVADHTMEGLALDLSNNPLGMVLYRDELATWLAGFDKYRAAGGGSDRANWLEIWSNKRVDVSRKTGLRVIYVPKPFVSVIGTIQPERLHELLGNMDDGFSDRLLCVYPAAGVPDLPERSISGTTMKAYERIITNLMEMDQDENGRARLAGLTPAALAVFKERGRPLTEALRDEDLAHGLAGAFAKLRLYASRLTLVLHQAAVAAGAADPFRVDVPYVEAAWDLTEYFQGHARMVHAAKLSDPEAMRAKHTMDLIARKGWASFNRRQVYMWLPTRFTRPEDADPALKLLCDHGFIRERQMPERTGRGRPPSQMYDVNPRWKPSTGSQIHTIHKNMPVLVPLDVPEEYDDEPF